VIDLAQVIQKRQERFTQATDQLQAYIDALDEYELNLLLWMESASSTTHFEGWVLYQFSRAVSCFRACKNLISCACNTDALALSRTIQDIYILVQWVSIDPDLRVKNATVDEVLKQRVYDAKRMVKHAGERVKNMPKEERAMIEDLASQDPRKMPGLPTTAKMAEEIQESGMYGSLFGMSSAFLHHQGSELQFLAVSRGTTTIEADPYPSKENLDLAWLSIYFTMQALWSGVAHILRQPITFDGGVQAAIVTELMEQQG